MSKKATCLGVRKRTVKWSLPATLERDDERVKQQNDIIHDNLTLLRPIESQIDILKLKAKPFKQAIEAAMETIQKGGFENVQCEITIDHNNCWIKAVRLDTGEVVADRKAEEKELDPDFFDEVKA